MSQVNFEETTKKKTQGSVMSWKTNRESMTKRREECNILSADKSKPGGLKVMH